MGFVNYDVLNVKLLLKDCAKILALSIKIFA